MPRKNLDSSKIRFATGAAGGRIAYRPNEVLIRNIGDVARDDLKRIVNLALDPDLTPVASTENSSATGFLRRLIELLRGLSSREVDPAQREQQLHELDEGMSEYLDRPGTHVGSRPRLKLGRRINDRWSVFVPVGDGSTIDPVEASRALRAAGLTAQPNYVRFINSLGAAPNYIAPNYIAPNYIAPNYIAPNYIAPNYIAPNYIAPNYIAAGQGGGACLCEPCADAPHVEREVPMITARGAYGPLPGPPATKLTKELAGGLAVEIHVLDVRFQTKEALTVEASTKLKDDLKAAKGNADDVLARQLDLEKVTTVADPSGPPTGRRSGLRPFQIRALNEAKKQGVADAEIDAAMKTFLVEPESKGLGANVNKDEFVDPTTNHAEFIQGIIDRIVRDENGHSVVRHQAIAGTLGDVSDEDLALSIDWVVANHTEESKLQIMNLSLSGYTDDDQPAQVLTESIEAAQQEKWLIVASAGNNGSCRLAWPAALKGVVSVAAYGPCGPAFFSNHGPWVDACGPGVGVVSNFTKPSKDDLLLVEKPKKVTVGAEFAPHGEATGHASWSGTSFSAPYVAAMLALRAVKEIKAAGGLATVEATAVPEVEEERRFAERWQAALAAMISNDDLIRFPGYGTIVSSEAVKVTQTVDREKNAP